MFSSKNTTLSHGDDNLSGLGGVQDPMSIPMARLAEFKNMAGSEALIDEGQGFSLQALQSNLASLGIATGSAVNPTAPNPQEPQNRAASRPPPRFAVHKPTQPANPVNPRASAGFIWNNSEPDLHLKVQMDRKSPQAPQQSLMNSPSLPLLPNIPNPPKSDNIYRRSLVGGPKAQPGQPFPLSNSSRVSRTPRNSFFNTTDSSNPVKNDTAQLTANVAEVKGENRHDAEAKLQDHHIFLYREGEDKAYRIEDLRLSKCTQQKGMLRIEGPFCVLLKLEFEDLEELDAWQIAVSSISHSHTSRSPPMTDVVKESMMVKVKDSTFGNRSVMGRLKDNHLQIFSSATSRSPYRIEDLEGAMVRLVNTCFFVDGPYCLASLYKLTDPEEAQQWVDAIQDAIDACNPQKMGPGGTPKLPSIRPALDNDEQVSSALGQIFTVCHDVVLGAPPDRRQKILDRVVEFSENLVQEFGGPNSGSGNPDE
jgi:hypothetical protein